MTTPKERAALLEKMSKTGRRGRRRFSDEEEAEIMAYVEKGYTYTMIAKAFAKDPSDDKEVKNISLVIGTMVKRAAKADEPEMLEEEETEEMPESGRPSTVIV